MSHQPAGNRQTVHASCVALDGTGVLIMGPSGSGKSAMALRLMALGARLVADDRTILEATQEGLIARCPPQIRGRIEARGVGILAAEGVACAPLRLVVDLGRQEEERLPPRRTARFLGREIALLHSPVHGHFPEAVVQYLKGGRCD